MDLFKYYFGGANKLLLTPHEVTKVPSSLQDDSMCPVEDEEKNTHSEREP